MWIHRFQEQIERTRLKNFLKLSKSFKIHDFDIQRDGEGSSSYFPSMTHQFPSLFSLLGTTFQVE